METDLFWKSLMDHFLLPDYWKTDFLKIFNISWLHPHNKVKLFVQKCSPFCCGFADRSGVCVALWRLRRRITWTPVWFQCCRFTSPSLPETSWSSSPDRFAFYQTSSSRNFIKVVFSFCFTKMWNGSSWFQKVQILLTSEDNRKVKTQLYAADF